MTPLFPKGQTKKESSSEGLFMLVWEKTKEQQKYKE